jgi:DNA mismatch endonuclease (patch repair protein)
MSASKRPLIGSVGRLTSEYHRGRAGKPASSQELTKQSKRTPSFSGLQPASSISSRIKRMNRNADTLHERLLRGSLWKRGLRFHKNVKHLPGKPDIVFPRSRLAVFCDGDFWHGRHWQKLSRKLRAGTNASYWILKIRGNMVRDRRHSLELARAGWRVVRLWETDILRDSEGCALIVESALFPDVGGNVPSARILPPAPNQFPREARPASVIAGNKRPQRR